MTCQIDVRIELDPSPACRERRRKILRDLLRAFRQIGGSRLVARNRILCRKLRGKRLQHSANHLFLIARLPLSDFNQLAQFRRKIFSCKKRKTTSDRRKRLRKIVDHAMQQNFFFLYFPQKALVP